MSTLRILRFEREMLKRMFGAARDEATRGWSNCITRNFATLGEILGSHGDETAFFAILTVHQNITMFVK
jgi:hypothetical protein